MRPDLPHRRRRRHRHRSVLGNHPKDGNGDGSSTGSPFNPFDDGPATVIGKLGGLFGVVETGADEPLTFSFITDQSR